ncbi:two-component regulator propeller domain-containing protein [Flavivirga abyssicola]|uniref:type IX secretion system anionic LPS delivery protein PorZ n=1 Tax=Flavivirga abyssicola TaxID=3063533 RepID=UPI0026DF1A36|nr:two-component regulator propeller domain-containing protein [Flavivirga sp. MEBiC07777]WVK14611.1 two-component regulator propeller domain-containing protein [Flavivirga sp. MEBiC07777]
MFKRLVVFIIFIFPLLQFAQDFSTLWEGHFSYNEIKDVTQGNNKIYAAAENAIFSLDIQTNNIEELTTVNGLSGETISTIYYSEAYELLVIGYENGLIEIAFDDDDDILSVVDIIDKPTIPTTDKRINHFNAYQNIIYISTNYGISVFDLERLEFGDTYFIGNGGSQIQVNQTTVFGDYIYAACMDGTGIRKGLVSSPNLIDYQNWQLVNSGNWLSIETHLDKLYAIDVNRRIYQIINDTLTEIFLYADAPLDMRAVDTNLIVTTRSNVFVYDDNFNLVSQAGIDSSFETQYVSAIAGADNIYIGTKDFGVLKTLVNNPVAFEEIHPDGPLLNTPFSIQAESGGLWVTFGEYDLFFNPYPLNNRGFSHLKEGIWTNSRYSEVFEAKCLNNIAINPFNLNQVFISSFFNGVLEVNEGIPTFLYNETNSGLESLILPSDPNYIDIRVGPSLFDGNGLLWTMTSQIDAPLKSYNPDLNQWKSYSFTDVITDRNLGFGDLVIGSDETKWIASYEYGLIGFSDNSGNPLLKSISSEEENMPSEYVTALALDERGQLWIGNFGGLRVLYNTSNFFNDENIRVEEIIIEEDGIAKELLFQQHVTDIEVDGSNNKWIGTANSGLFYFSSDGQKTIFHFTKDNSPLPSSSVRDVSIDGTNGTVYIATSKGLVSFRSGGSSPFEDLESAFAYPNPVRPGFNIVDEKVKIKDISENVNIKITDIEGNLVAEAQSRTNQRYGGYNLEIDGGTAYWNGKNMANNVVASGVYLIMLSDLDSFETKVLKLMVVR